MSNEFMVNNMDTSGRITKTTKPKEKPICDSDNSKSITRLRKIDGSIFLKKEELIIDEDTRSDAELITENIS